jgi:Cation transport ATPase
MDGPPALTLGLEPIRDDLMKRSPVSRDSSIISKEMLGKIVFNGLFISAVFLSQTATNFLGGTPEQAPTILFTLFVVFQLFNAFNCRELSDNSIFANITNNKLMLLVFSIVFTMQVLITQFGKAFFGTVALPLMMWIKIAGIALSIIVASEILKFIKKSLVKKLANKSI